MALTKEKLSEYNKNLFNYIKENNPLYETLYLDLGTKVIRLLCYSDLFIPHIKKQMTYTLKRNSGRFDATIVLWQENNIKSVFGKIAPEFDLRNNLRFRIEFLATRCLVLFYNDFSHFKPIISVNTDTNIINSYDIESETYFYGVKNLEPEEFIKEGHILVQILNNILKTENTNLVHGACIGLNNKGVLLCARGQRGKSTLAVLSMMEGFEYVSDDYLTLEKEGNNLFAHPIYSIITLSPRMYNELYDRLEGARFVSNNARKDKYVINISNFHNQFKKRYPIKMCMFPEIVSDEKPSIQECNEEEKGRAITHLIHSTIFQMNDRHDTKTIKKLINMVKGFRFYKIYLCNNIYSNTECLKQFLREKENG
ncbi:hypothetical protein IKQ26_02040 [bacterium]|nr:hypothetical protein [bacterium]